MERSMRAMQTTFVMFSADSHNYMRKGVVMMNLQIDIRVWLRRIGAVRKV
jgi:hypothetical protein